MGQSLLLLAAGFNPLKLSIMEGVRPKNFKIAVGPSGMCPIYR